MSKHYLLLITLNCLLIVPAGAQDLVDRAHAFLNSLSPELQREAQFSIEDDERKNFHFIPKMRKGPNFHDMGPDQKKAALALLGASLSDQGYQKSIEIMELENVLLSMGQDYKFPDGSPVRDPLRYHLTVFGEPSREAPWGWRFEGHHISLNFTSHSGKVISSTPSFFGSNPGIVSIEPYTGRQVLKKESTLALDLVNSLSDTQLGQARFSETAPRGIFTGIEREVALLEPMGISYTALTHGQQEAFMDLLEVYIGNYIFDFAEVLRRKIMEAGVDKLHFAWAGGMKWGQPHYYRIQGPMLIIEYDNTQDDANHVHTVVRDLTNDFAEDFLREHYEKEHKN
ncbi:DUF3500 domain-containing protein [Lentiprolixibacter aurantiacus]|uniref:DUF3500 domain-containing protein n=1 Tax=Lentiprolixibacter aurantiacus TaxID=2993939 RepID=A0AAE3MNV1_9FLAO|nr:DUF3500 domain-containing protein [Lentiprolixibacter aurantiacus]MCX2720638.1 DUF3500 domain-containing protein [Lentiprolixibacter aurantiacus]